MITYPKILFPLDLSPESHVIAEHVASMVGKFGAELHIVNVVPRYEGPAFSSMDDVRSEIKHNVLQEIAKFTEKHFSQVESVEAKVLTGHNGRQILAYIDKHDISLVVMGTHGRSGLGSVFFGSVAQRVVQSAKVPVMTVHPMRQA